ncbi:hypothetical protein ACIBP6_28125 [Nonomuraea terrae]|uniref:hypothetical protein n=1 Tax=Nonomuraea terrae TaxID=2530383 RepID=UPI0037ABEA8E
MDRPPQHRPVHRPRGGQRLAGIVQGVMLSLTAGSDADQAGAVTDELLSKMPALHGLAEAMREAEYRRAVTT